MQRYYRWLVVILVIWAMVIYVDLPNNPGIHILGINKSLQTQEGLDLRGGISALLEVDLPANVPVTSQEMQDVIAILQSRANGLGVSEVTFQTSGTRRIVAEFPGATDTAQVIASLSQVGQLAFISTGSTFLAAGTPVIVDYSQIQAQQAGTATPGPTTSGTAPATETPTDTSTPTLTATPTETQTPTPGPSGTPSASGTPAPSATSGPQGPYPAVITGAALSTVNVTTGTLGSYVIDFTLKPEDAQVFYDFTSSHIGQYLCIVLDNAVISCPTINNAISNGSGQISGNFTAQTANDLAINLRYGALPVPLKVVQTQTVGATLGQDSINKSIRAGLIGLAMVIILMLVNYRLPGMIADIALILYAMTTFAVYRIIPVTLTLPGIAGFVLSLGVAVDANILIFERMKEEMRAGYNLHQSIDLGWSRAWPSIRDSNISTLITCVILFWFGSTFGATIVQGFALTLGLGVLVSLFTAIVATRTFLHIVLDNLKFAEHPRWFAK